MAEENTFGLGHVFLRLETGWEFGCFLRAQRI
jgi:hypothetical protein